MPVSFDLSGTTTLVTGSSGGIGAAIASAFAAAGAAVVIHYHRSEEHAQNLAGEITGSGGEAVAVPADLTQPDSVRVLVNTAAQFAGPLSSVVNAAGIQPLSELASMTMQDWRNVIDNDLNSAFLLTQTAAAALRGRGGSITHIASIEASQPARAHGHYNAAKAGLVMHARSAALEYGAAGVRVNTVSPGLIDRPGLSEQWPEGVQRWNAAAPLTRLGTGEDVANACLYLASPLASWITGTDMVVDGGVSAHPTW